MASFTAPIILLKGYVERKTRLEVGPNIDPRDGAIAERWARDVRHDVSPLQRLLGRFRAVVREGRPDVLTRSGEALVRAVIHEEMAAWRRAAAGADADGEAPRWRAEAEELGARAASDRSGATVAGAAPALGTLELGVQLCG
ncbi:hypothetical protein BH11MYX1_BH11MYX1_27380 [soil metagenome]